jgi:hypothetical protein
MKTVQTKKFIKEPKRKLFGWSYYLENITHVYGFKQTEHPVWKVKVDIRGKKFCLFNRFLWDYQIEALNYQQYLKQQIFV